MSKSPPVLENKIGANAPMRIGEGVEPCNMLPFGKPRYRCDHQSAANIRIKFQTTKLSCYRCHSTLRNPIKNEDYMDLKDYLALCLYVQFNAKLPNKSMPNYRIPRNYIIFDIFYNYVFLSKDYLDLMDYIFVYMSNNIICLYAYK